MSISLCMIVKNEEAHIVDCVKNALDIVDEAIVVDTGSTDKTVELLKENFGSRVQILFEPWENDFSKARNKSMSRATGEWILILDGDEVPSFDKNLLRKTLKNQEYRVYSIPILSFSLGAVPTYAASMPRLFKNDNPQFVGKLHEQLLLNGKEIGGTPLSKDVIKIYHYGYKEDVIKEKDKTERNLKIAQQEVALDNQKPFNWYKLAVAHMQKKEFKKALDAFEKWETVKKGKLTYEEDVILRKISCLHQIEAFKDLEDYFERAERNFPKIKTNPEFYCRKGLLEKTLGRNKKAILDYTKALKIGETLRQNSVLNVGIGSFVPLFELGRIYLEQGQVNLAIALLIHGIFVTENEGFWGRQEVYDVLEKESRSDLSKKVSRNLEFWLKDNLNQKEDGVELSMHKEKIRKIVEEQITNGKIDEAKKIIEQYDETVAFDVEIMSLKMVLSLIENDFLMSVFYGTQYLRKYPYNFDALYNLAYTYENFCAKEMAKVFYGKLLPLASGKEKNEVKEALERVK